MPTLWGDRTYTIAALDHHASVLGAHHDGGTFKDTPPD